MSKPNPLLDESLNFLPRFDENGLLPVIVVETCSKQVLMLAYVNQTAIIQTLKTGLAHYFSRSQNKIWQKGEESGFIQKVNQIRLDCDQDTLIFEVEQVGGAACHTGRVSCFYRKLILNKNDKLTLEFTDQNKLFDPKEVYKK